MTKNMIYIIITLILISVGAWYWNYSKYSSMESSFIKMAKLNHCASNFELYSIDNNKVFWNWRGLCSDYSYGYVLFGETPEQILCRETDNIAGPKKECTDTSVEELFKTIVIHKGPDLGLDSTHTVKKFYEKSDVDFNSL